MTDDRRAGSYVLLALGIVLAGGGIIGAALGLKDLMDSLNTAGYGSVEVRNALIFMGAAGAALGTGISLLIWDTANRLGARR
ncbi:MAG: hypothetical protein AB7O67_18830 [Vicinamibacterales bacterium]